MKKKYSSGWSVLTREFPRLGIFPRNVARVVQVKQQAFAAIEESEAEEVVVDESEQRTHDDVGKAEAAVALRDCQLRAQRGITVHVAEVERKVGVGVMNKS